MSKSLRPYQSEMKEMVYQRWEESHRNVLMCLPTGMGKTFLFCSIAKDKAVIAQNKCVTAIVVHRKELVQQISLTLADEGITHNIIAPKPTIMGIIAAQRTLYGQQFYNYLSPVSVVSVDTLNARILAHEKWAKSVQLWITDEAAHVLKNNKWGRAIEYFPNAIGLGVTATPQRLDKKGLGRHADGVFDVMVEGPTTKWGIIHGYLCKYKIAVPGSDYQNYLKSAGVGSDYTRDAMEEAAHLSHIIGDVVENYVRFARGKQAILFAPGIKTAQEMRDKFTAANIPALLLTGLSSDKERLDGMTSFKNKETKVLLNVDLFDEGLDVPGIECVIHARPTMSLSKYRQMNGRGMRPSPDKEFLIIIDHVGNVSRHGYPSEDVEWTLDRGVKRRDKINLIRICSNHECNAPYDRSLTECPYCGTEAVRSGGGGGGERVPPEQVDGDLFLIDPFTLEEMEAETHLEDPGSVGARVAKAAGAAAAISAIKNQKARIETQKELADVIARWSGKQRWRGLTDRQIHKRFWLEREMTITYALSRPKSEMQEIIEILKGEI